MKKRSWMGWLSVLTLGMAVIVGGVLVIRDNLHSIRSSQKLGEEFVAANKQQMDLNRRLMRAASDGDLIEVTELVEQGAYINYTDPYGWTPLIQATMMNRLDVVKYLVVKGADIKAIAEDGTNPLQNAIIFDHVAMVKFLLARGASLETVGKYGWNGFETAKQRDRRKVLNYFQHEGLMSQSAH